jgi:hypothetical protein
VPWGLSDARTTFFTTFGGLAGLVMAWWGASGTGKLDRQVTWMVVGIAAVVVIGVGNFFWLLAGRRAVGVRRGMLLDALDAATPSPASVLPGVVVAGRTTAHVTIAGSSRYHVPSCLLARGKAVAAVDAAATRDLVPCEMCRP